MVNVLERVMEDNINVLMRLMHPSFNQSNAFVFVTPSRRPASLQYPRFPTPSRRPASLQYPRFPRRDMLFCFVSGRSPAAVIVLGFSRGRAESHVTLIMVLVGLGTRTSLT